MRKTEHRAGSEPGRALRLFLLFSAFSAFSASSALLLFFCLGTAPAHAQGRRPVAITHVSIIDATDALPRADQTVVIRGSHITTAGPSRSTPIPGGARVIDGRGKFLIPGLWDMHVHSDVPGARLILPLYVANGVTGVRDMGGRWDSLTSLRNAVRSGAFVGPRMILSGPYLDGNDQPIGHLLVKSPAEAAAAVDSLARLGVDLVKLHTGLTREAWLAGLHQARVRGLPAAGHVPRVVGAMLASDSGLGSIEHLLTIPTPCTPAESLALEPRYPTQGALGRCSSAEQRPLYTALAHNGTRVTPTFTAQVEVAGWPRRSLPGDSLAGYLPDTLRRYVAGIFPMPDSIPPGSDSVGMAIFRKRLALVGALARAGVHVLAGTDAPLRNSPPGFGLHEELMWLVEAGLSPHAVLSAATLGAATFLHLEDSLGTVAPGKLADLVLLDANPLQHIRNTRRIRAVFQNGVAFDSAARAALLTPREH